MRKQSFFIESLMKWYEKEQRILPWRSNPSPYRVWISEIMLQQTQVKAVLPYFEKFISAFPNVKKLAAAEESKVLKYWSGLGYYTRARNIHATSKILLERHKGSLPVLVSDLIKLPGIGRYTAGAISSIAWNQPVSILDGNVERVLSRVYAVFDPGKKKEELWALAQNLVVRADQDGVAPRDFNQALMEWGALVCLPKKPDCRVCFNRKICSAFDRDEVDRFPERRQRAKTIKMHEERLLLLSRRKKVFLIESKKGAWRQGLWDLPGESEIFQMPKIKPLKTSSVKLTVTNHLINRKTKLFLVESQSSIRPARGIKSDWVPLEKILAREIAMGASLSKSIGSLITKER